MGLGNRESVATYLSDPVNSCIQFSDPDPSQVDGSSLKTCISMRNHSDLEVVSRNIAKPLIRVYRVGLTPERYPS